MLFLRPSVCLGITLLGWFFATPGHAQKTKPTSATVVQAPNVKYGSIQPEALRGHPFPQDTTAEAVVLYERCVTRIDYSGGGLVVVSEIHRRLRILTKSGLDRATISIPVYSVPGKSERIESVEGVTYNLTGTGDQVSTTKLSRAGIVTERVSDNVSYQKLTLPNVREGFVIEYRYEITTPFEVTANPRTWSFQDDIPTLWSEYQITYANNFYYKMVMNGYTKLVVNETKQVVVRLPELEPEPVPGQRFRFATANVPALREEAYITSLKDYATKIDLELARVDFPGRFTKEFSVGWDNIDRTLLTDSEFGGQIGRAAFLRDIANAINRTHPAADTLARLEAAQQAVGKAVKWDESASYYSTNIKKAFAAGKGNAGDINLTLIALLREMGLNANPVVLSTREHGRLDLTWGLIKRLDYVVAHVPLGGKDLLLDATDPYLKPGALPMRALNGAGRLVLPKDSRFVPLNSAEREVEAITGQFKLQADGGISGTMTRSFGGYGSYKARKTYHAQGETDYLTGVKKNFGDWQISKASFDGTDNVNLAFMEVYEMNLPDGMNQAGERLYLRPMLTEGRTKNPFPEPDRQFPVDFGMQLDETYTASFALPDGYQADELPKSVSMALPENAGRFIYRVTASEGKMQIVSRLMLKKPVYYADEYPALRELFAQVVAKHAEMVVLKKVKSEK
jgi:transglutaminase-like putative cysteine protease